MKKDKPKPRYGPGDKVTTFFTDNEVLMIKNVPKWNGLVWMYDFENTGMRCGENYLSKILNSNVV